MRKGGGSGWRRKVYEPLTLGSDELTWSLAWRTRKGFSTAMARGVHGALASLLPFWYSYAV